LDTDQGKVKQVVVEEESKLIHLTTQAVEEITTTKTEVVKEVEVAKATSQPFISTCKNKKQD
jgi:hypothetical protein